MALLSETIGLDITTVQVEDNVGDFNVDIYAIDETSGKRIIIENQLEKTNHDHLGKIITYDSGKDANYIVWIVKKARNEHRQAIDWLNEHTDSELNFFLIEMELWKIGNSDVAPKFQIICQPNDWTKMVKETYGTGETTELKTKRSRRKLPLFPVMRDILIAHREWLGEYSRSLGGLWQETGVVCPNTTGGLMDKAAPNKAVKKIVSAREDLPRGLHAHSLRHSFVSLLIANGLDVVSVAALAGDTIEIISKHYAHSFAERRAAAMDAVGASFASFGGVAPPLPLIPSSRG